MIPQLLVSTLGVLPCLFWVATMATGVSGEPDPRGPIQSPGMTVTAKPGAVEAKGFHFDNKIDPPEMASPKWIWLDSQTDGAGSPPVAALYRKVLSLTALPKKADAWISADVSYRLYVNGRLVARGPADIGRDYDREPQGPRWLYDHWDLTGTLHRGENVIAAEVFTKSFYTSRVSRGKHGLLFHAQLESGKKRRFVDSDESWLVKADPSWDGEGRYDLTHELQGWRSPSFDAASWKPAVAVQSIWTPLAPSEIPPRMEARYPLQSLPEDGRSLPVKAGGFEPITISSASQVVLHYDRVLAAYPTFRLDGVAGAVVRIVPGERIGHQSRVCSLTLRDGIQTFEYPYIDSFSVLKLEFSGIPPGRHVTLLDAGANFTSMPLQYSGSFECSDPHYNDLWATSRWLTQICMQTHHLDSPNHQEPICDPGDYLIESHANYYAFGFPWLARQDLQKFGLMLKDLNYRNFHTSYSLLWLQMLMAYYDYTGDASLVKELTPEVEGLLDTFTSWRGKNGLISEAPNYMFMDWVTIAGFGCHHPPAVIGQGYMTAFYYRALADGIRVAELNRDPEKASDYARLRSEVKEAFNRELWSDAQGLYRDGRPNQTHVKAGEWLPADTDIETFSPHVNTLAVLYDLAPLARQAGIMDKVFEGQPINCQPYFTYFVLEALHHCGRFEAHAPGLLSRWHIEPETHTYHEMWTEGDLSHAWGSSPLIQMSSTVLGVRPTAPGFARFAIQPTLMNLQWAQGVVPTPHGSIEVAWRRDGGRLTLEARIPSGTVAEVLLPGGRTALWPAGKSKVTVACP